MKGQNNAASSARDTINRIRAKQNAAKSDSAASPDTPLPPAKETLTRQRVSHLSKPASVNERNEVRIAVMKALLLGEISQGEALKLLRINVLGLKQDAFAKMVGVSRKTLSDIENGKGNYSSDIINKLFKPFGLQVGLIPLSRHLLTTLLTE